MIPPLPSHHWRAMPQLHGTLLALLTMFGASIAQAQTPAPAHESFDTAMHAVRALVTAAKNNDINRLLAIFGPGADELVESGDPVADKRDRASFVKAYRSKHTLIADGADRDLLRRRSQRFSAADPARAARWAVGV